MIGESDDGVVGYDLLLLLAAVLYTRWDYCSCGDCGWIDLDVS